MNPQQTAVEYRTCRTCGLTLVGSHGMVDCVAEFRRQIKNLRQEKFRYEVRATLAEERLAEIRKALAE